MKKRRLGTALLCAVLLNASGLQGAEGPDATPVKEPLKVYILFGQSNMLGFGKVSPETTKGTLEYVVRKRNKYTHLVDKDGNWVVRKDVRYVHVMQGGRPFRTLRNEWLTVGGKHVGPEMGIGHALGDFHDETVLVLKACIGNRSLGWDYLPPGSERFEYRGKMHAGYRDVSASWTRSETPDTDWQSGAWYAGKQYDDDVRYAKAVLADLDTYCPGAKTYEIAGFFWWQGHKDQNKLNAMRYERNLVNFIKALRKDFNAPGAPFVCATIAFGGRRMAGHALTIAKAQLAVSGEKGKYPEFNGNVKTVDARPFWQPRRRSPGGGGHHYNGNAETYMDVGDAMGKAMVALIKGEE
jgi:alpha-galactosidase